MEISLQSKGFSFDKIQSSFRFPFLHPKPEKSNLSFPIRWRNTFRCLSLDRVPLCLENSKKIRLRKAPSKELIDELVYDFQLTQAEGLFEIFEAEPSCFKRLFKYMINNGFHPDVFMEKRVMLTVLVCGMIREPRQFFDEMDFVCWISEFGGLFDCADDLDTCDVLRLGTVWNWGPLTFSIMIRAATELDLVFAGRQLHSCALKMGIGEDNSICGALIDLYSKCGSLEEAKTVFYAMPEQNTAGWNSMIASYSLHCYYEEGLSLFSDMRAFGVPTDHLTFAIAIEIFAMLGYLNIAEANDVLSECYDDFPLDSTRTIWSVSGIKPPQSWNLLLEAHGNYGQGDKAVELFMEMLLDEGVIPDLITLRSLPDSLTFYAVLSACSKSRILERGRQIFHSMTRDHGIEPDATHFACMIEILGREMHLPENQGKEEGFLVEALALIRSAPVKPTVDMWAALLTACRVNQNIELGKLAAEELYALEPEKLSNSIVLSNVYKSWGMSKEANEVLDTLQRKGLRIPRPCSWIKINEESHVFFSGDKRHAQTEEIYQKADELMQQISRLGHVDGVKTTDLLADVDETEQSIEKYHSEILAIAFGLINTADRPLPLMILQDHRICDGCHEAVKFMAMAAGRKIVVKDASRFHHFRGEECSCENYW